MSGVRVNSLSPDTSIITVVASDIPDISTSMVGGGGYIAAVRSQQSTTKPRTYSQQTLTSLGLHTN